MSLNQVIRLVLSVGLLAGVPAARAWAKPDTATRLLQRASSLHGPTGWINIPSADVSASGDITAGIHRGEAKINLSLLGFFEGGIYFEADRLGHRFEQYRNLSSWDLCRDNLPAFVKESFRGQAKLRVLDPDWFGVGLAAGLEEQNRYVVAERYFPELSRVTVVAGWGTGRFAKGFGGLSKAIIPGSEFVLEYDGEGVNAGVRMLLSRNLILCLAIKDMNTIGEVQNLGEVIGQHFLFGITFVEKAW